MVDGVDLRRAVFFQPNRVWRCYTGGLLLDRFIGRSVGNPGPADGHFPEEWIASTTVALNGPHQQSEDEGLSRVRLPDGSAGPLLRDLVLQAPEECLGPGVKRQTVAEEGIGVLNKFLDSAVRLPIQCHPDRAFAREHYHSEHGKTEAWIILGTREIEGQEPCLLMGFKPGTRPEAFAEAVRGQDIPAMVAMLHRIPARPGEAYIIPGRFPHAIGPGVFLLEVQEPTDWVVQPERWIGDTELSDSDMWGPLTPEVGLECFDYAGAGTIEAVTERCRLPSQTIAETEDARREQVIGPAVTDCFRLERLTVRGELDYSPHEADALRPSCSGRPEGTRTGGAPFQVAIVTGGRGEVQAGGDSRPVKRGDTFFVSNQVESLRYRNAGDGDEPFTVYLVSTGTAG